MSTALFLPLSSPPLSSSTPVSTLLPMRSDGSPLPSPLTPPASPRTPPPPPPPSPPPSIPSPAVVRDLHVDLILLSHTVATLRSALQQLLDPTRPHLLPPIISTSTAATPPPSTSLASLPTLSGAGAPPSPPSPVGPLSTPHPPPLLALPAARPATRSREPRWSPQPGLYRLLVPPTSTGSGSFVKFSRCYRYGAPLAVKHILSFVSEDRLMTYWQFLRGSI